MLQCDFNYWCVTIVWLLLIFHLHTPYICIGICCCCSKIIWVRRYSGCPQTPRLVDDEFQTVTCFHGWYKSDFSYCKHHFSLCSFYINKVPFSFSSCFGVLHSGTIHSVGHLCFKKPLIRKKTKTKQRPTYEPNRGSKIEVWTDSWIWRIVTPLLHWHCAHWHIAGINDQTLSNIH